MVEERFLVTGALGCVGAWTVRELVREGVPVVGFDVGDDRRRLRLLLSDDEVAGVPLVAGDITDLTSIERAIADHGITNVIHLAALQIPFCRADPPLGARVNVGGTVNVFEAVRRRAAAGGTLAPVVYAGSIGMFSPGDVDAATGQLREDADAHPGNLYGVTKLANEGTARVFWTENGVASVGIRPMTVFGAGRDQGMTSSPTVAIVAAVLGIRYRITFGGSTLFQYTEDVARTLILASRSAPVGPRVFNLGGSPVSIDAWIEAIDDAVPGAAELLSHEPTPLPFPADIEHARLAELGAVPVRPYRDAITATAALFERLAADGRLDGRQQGIPAPS
jgi:UDP-glucuronate 4-epimerase